jgi:hypothetical protein
LKLVPKKENNLTMVSPKVIEVEGRTLLNFLSHEMACMVWHIFLLKVGGVSRYFSYVFSLSFVRLTTPPNKEGSQLMFMQGILNEGEGSVQLTSSLR